MLNFYTDLQSHILFCVQIEIISIKKKTHYVNNNNNHREIKAIIEHS